MDKHIIANILREIANLLDLQGENPFKIRAYINAARNLELTSENIHTLIKEGRLHEIDGIGKGIEEKIKTIYESGTHPLYEKLKKELPEGLLMIEKIPGLGSKKTHVLYQTLGITTIDGLKKACLNGKIETLDGFGKKTAENILDGIQNLERYSQRHLWWNAIEIAEPILKELKRQKGVKKAEIGGSLRRKLETVGDIDFLVASAHPKHIMDWFTAQKQVVKILSIGKTKSSVRLQGGIQADLRVVSEKEYPYALLYFTGSKEHNINIRHIARGHGLSLNEWGFTPLNTEHPPDLLKKNIKSEKDLYQLFGFSYIPPELREDTGEIEAAKSNNLPKLVEESNIRGVFHVHTTESDGKNSLEEMIQAAEKYHWEYLGITDHSQSSTQANGLSEERLIRQMEEIHTLNQSGKFNIHIFSGTECDILKDGTLDFPNSVLQELDFVIVSIHRNFQLDENSMTKRIIKAIEHPLSTMVGHLTGRLLLKREPYQLNVEKVIDAAIANNKIIELNAAPERLDMDWRLWHKAAEKGLLCSINPDAHSTAGLDFYRIGVNIARKGWLTKENIFNTFPLENVKEFFKTLKTRVV